MIAYIVFTPPFRHESTCFQLEKTFGIDLARKTCLLVSVVTTGRSGKKGILESAFVEYIMIPVYRVVLNKA